MRSKTFVEVETALAAISLGARVLTSPPRHELSSSGRRRWVVEVRCTGCSREYTVHVDNLLFGKSRNCKCQSGLALGHTKGSVHENLPARRLAERYDAILQRCQNPAHPSYPNYGGRGIALKFGRGEFVTWCLDQLPHPTYEKLQIDRINNDGHYEPGNLRLVDAGTNLRNRRNSVRIRYRDLVVNASDLGHILHFHFPTLRLSYSRVAKLATAGVPWHEIIERQSRSKRSKSDKPSPTILARYGIDDTDRPGWFRTPDKMVIRVRAKPGSALYR